MFITVQLTPDGASALRTTQPHLAGGLKQTLRQLRVDLQPLHPGVSDADLATQYYAAVNDAEAGAVCARLLEDPAVMAAYPKPAGSPPSGPP